MYSILADAVDLFHGVVVIFLVVTFVLLFFRKKGPDWIRFLGGLIAIIATIGITINLIIGNGFECILVTLSDYLHSLDGKEGLKKSFITHYLEGLFSVDISIFWGEIIDKASGLALGVVALLSILNLRSQQDRDSF